MDRYDDRSRRGSPHRLLSGLRASALDPALTRRPVSFHENLGIQLWLSWRDYITSGSASSIRARGDDITPHLYELLREQARPGTHDVPLRDLHGDDSGHAHADSLLDLGRSLRPPSTERPIDYIGYTTEEHWQRNLRDVERVSHRENAIYHTTWDDTYYLRAGDATHRLAALVRQNDEQRREFAFRERTIVDMVPNRQALDAIGRAAAVYAVSRETAERVQRLPPDLVGHTIAADMRVPGIAGTMETTTRLLLVEKGLRSLPLRQWLAQQEAQGAALNMLSFLTAAAQP